MKTKLFALLFSIIIAYPLSSQNFSIKNYPLKNYTAPDIKYRSLNLILNLTSTGLSGSEINNLYGSSFLTGLNYFEYLNTAKHQGTTNGNFDAGFTSKIDDEESTNKQRFSMLLSYLTQNRFYFSNKVFLGVHGNLVYRVTPLDKEKENSKYDRKDQTIRFTPYISFGKGRVEPVESARRAMDILIALKKHQRLAKEPDSAVLTEFARLANKVRYKRFFDRRFKTIYQLEELDKALQDHGLVKNADIVYFSNLNDIWNYAPNFQRGSGYRIEGGIIPDIYYSEGESTNDNSSSEHEFNGLGGFGFVSFNRMRPVNYAWQSNIMIDLTAGFSKFKYLYEANSLDEYYKSDDEYSEFLSALTASWQFGFFPNTRTHLGITPFVGFSYSQEMSDNENTIGGIAGLDFSTYYYISPRVRLSVETRLDYGENYDFGVPTPFWNSVSFSNNSADILRQSNEESTFPIDVRYYGNKSIQYYVYIRLSYAIF